MFSTSVRWLERGCLSDSMRRQLRPWWWHRRRNNKKSLLQPPIVAMYNDSSSDISIFQIFHDISYEVPMYVKMSDNCNYSEPSLLPTDDRWQINPLSATCAGLFACIFWSGPRSLGRSQHVSAFFDRSPDDWGHNYVGTEMLLVGVVADTSGPSGKVLKKFNVTLKDGNLVCQAEISSWFLFAAFTCNLVCRKTWPHLTPRDFIWFPGYYIYIHPLVN